MASIDQYKHRHLGFINCPSEYDIVNNNATRDIAVYELLEDISEKELDFDGKCGDILVGGGRGEVPAFRITIPDALTWLMSDKDVSFESYDQLFKSFWTPTDAYKLCSGFRKLGWDAKRPIEFWIVENVCAILVNEVESFRKLGDSKKLQSQFTWRT